MNHGPEQAAYASDTETHLPLCPVCQRRFHGKPRQVYCSVRCKRRRGNSTWYLSHKRKVIDSVLTRRTGRSLAEL